MNAVRQSPQPPIRIKHVITAWSLAADVSHGSPGPATPSSLAEAERLLGFTLPPDLRELYAAYDGGSFLGGNIHLYPLLPTTADDPALLTESDHLREAEWEVPLELVIFGDDGSEVDFGLWLHDSQAQSPLIVALSEDRGLAVVGDSLAGFLAGHSAFYLLLYAEDGYDLAPALDALGLPDALREYNSLDDGLYNRLLNWANPNLPDKDPDPWAHRVTPEQINEIARRRTE